eukprot:scaffold98713_cov21-Prasinocladus_malaysianus.AAC.1
MATFFVLPLSPLAMLLLPLSFVLSSLLPLMPRLLSYAFITTAVTVFIKRVVYVTGGLSHMTRYTATPDND